MMAANTYDTDLYQINLLEYLSSLNGDLSPINCREHYRVLKLALLRIQSEDLATFDLALKQVSKKLGIKAKTVKEDLAALAEPPANKDARELLEQMGQTRPLRLAQDFVDNKLWFGVMAGENKLLLNSDREQERNPLLLAAWTLGTYCYCVFRVFPYLAFRSPEKRCGKSRVLDELSLLAFNASPRVVYPTEAQIFRAPSRNGSTLLLDEVEALKNADKENYAGLLAVLNSGFERGGTVSRLKKTADGNFPEQVFETFCPRAIAGINKLADTLEDRSIAIMMQRRLAREKTERFSPSRLEGEAQALRDRCYLWALAHATDLAAVYDKADETFPSLNQDA